MIALYIYLGIAAGVGLWVANLMSGVLSREWIEGLAVQMDAPADLLSMALPVMFVGQSLGLGLMWPFTVPCYFAVKAGAARWH